VRPDHQRGSAIQGGTVKAYAIATDRRVSYRCQCAYDERGRIADYQASAWNALFAPKDTPKRFVATFRPRLDKALDDDAAPANASGISVQRVSAQGPAGLDAPVRRAVVVSSTVKSVRKWTRSSCLPGRGGGVT